MLRVLRDVWAFPGRHKVWAAITIGVAFIAFITYVPRLSFVVPMNGLKQAADRTTKESDYRGHLIQAIGGIVLLVGAYFTARTFALNREGQITERFTRAVQQLDSNKLATRLGGVYALERIAHDSKTHSEQVIQVLTVFLRERAPWKREDDGARRPCKPGEVRTPPLPVDVQAAAALLGRRDRRAEHEYPLDLNRVDLRRASLPHGHLEGWFLEGAHLEMALLHEAHLDDANLANAHLEAADLTGAHLRGTKLDGAHLEGTNLHNATGLTQGQLEVTSQDDATNLPEYVLHEPGE